MKAVVAAFNQEKALVGAFSVIAQLHRLIDLRHSSLLSPAQNRVLVRGQVSTLHAYTFAAVLATSSTTLLWHLVCPLTATLSLANLVLYTSVYTPMKRYFLHQYFLESSV